IVAVDHPRIVERRDDDGGRHLGGGGNAGWQRGQEGGEGKAEHGASLAVPGRHRIVSARSGKKQRGAYIGSGRLAKIASTAALAGADRCSSQRGGSSSADQPSM